MGISSRRPTNIPIISNHFAASFNPIKFEDGPIRSPKPGPILPKAATAPETDVTRSNPVNDSNIASTPRLKKKHNKKSHNRVENIFCYRATIVLQHHNSMWVANFPEL